MRGSPFSAVLIGSESLLIQCGTKLLEAGHDVCHVITPSAEIRAWASGEGIAHSSSVESFLSAPPDDFDYLFSITHLEVLPTAVLERPRRLAINFHDGPLPEYSGLNVTTWALLDGARHHAVTWHVIEPDVDTGPILLSQAFEVAPDETAFSLNTRCYEAGIATFDTLIDRLASGTENPAPQDGNRRVFLRAHRPPAGLMLLPSMSASEQHRMIRALDFGGYDNPVGLPRLPIAGRTVLIRAAEIIDSTAEEGTVIEVSDQALAVATREGGIRYTAAVDTEGHSVDLKRLAADLSLTPGSTVSVPDSDSLAAFDTLDRLAARSEHRAVQSLRRPLPVRVPFADSHRRSDEGPQWARVEYRAPSDRDSLLRGDAGGLLIAAVAVFLGKLGSSSDYDVNVRGTPSSERGPIPDEAKALWAHAFRFDIPVRLDFKDRRITIRDAVDRASAKLDAVLARTVLHADVGARYDVLDESARTVPDVVIDVTADGASPTAALLQIRVFSDGLVLEHDSSRLATTDVERIRDCFDRFLGVLSDRPRTPLGEVDLLDDQERRTLVVEWNQTARSYDPDICIHEAFRRSASSTPDEAAVSWPEGSLTYGELDRRSNQLAHVLRSRGVSRGSRVGVCTDRSGALLVSVLGVLKSGAAYVPLDPDFPEERVRRMVSDARLGLVVCQPPTRDLVGASGVPMLDLEAESGAIEAAADESLEPVATADDPAYVIYTSGSTGRPKGVVVLHRNVANFFAAMDDIIPIGERRRWLAVTSLSFDISVLELLWTLANGFEVILHSPVRDSRGTGTRVPGRALDFSLFFFSSGGDGEPGPESYRLLFESVEFADSHGFSAVWTPERHFHAFGGLFPNPSVVSAALAARTRNIHLRAGSCVSPLHHPVRVAEEWSVVDNISNGRVGIAFASGWQPNDFVLRPENFADRKNVMFDQIETIRALWRGEPREFPGHSGEPVEVRTLPRPVQAELPVWITTAGNPETFRMAGEAGYNILTHLLGQSMDDIAEKVRHYREGRQSAGHDGPGQVTLMLHTFVHPDPEYVRASVRDPMKSYLRSAIGLVKDAAWSFPTFKEKTIDETGRFTMDRLTPEDMDALLEHAFERYYESSGFFGTPQRCAEIAARLADTGIDEVACLIDFGVGTDATLASLEHLDTVRELCSQAGDRPATTFAEVASARDVSHLQCTPSMARMLIADEASRTSLSGLDVMCVGGEALPDALAKSIREACGGRVLNMYGPTETTIWSTVADLSDAGDVTIGRPIANTTLYICDPDGQPTPVGVPGELLIGGDGVTAGYLDRPEITAERFIPDRFGGSGMLYRTGDMCRYRHDGEVEFLGRSDGQIKIRGYRIELGEIEHELSELAGVAAAVAMVRRDTTDEPTLIGYVVEAERGAFDADIATERLSRRLPQYMIPSRFVTLAEIPLTPNGKIDRGALPAPGSRTRRSEPTERPKDGLEQLIAETWSAVLEVDGVGADENFFDIGGHSLLAVQVNARLSEALDRELSLIDFFRYPTVRTLAAHLGDDGETAEMVAVEAGMSRAEARRAALRRRGR